MWYVCVSQKMEGGSYIKYTERHLCGKIGLEIGDEVKKYNFKNAILYKKKGSLWINNVVN